MKIIFDKNAKEWVLNIFNKSVDTNGFVIENDSNKQRVLSPEGKEIANNDLAIIAKGSEKFIAGDLTSLMKFSKGEL